MTVIPHDAVSLYDYERYFCEKMPADILGYINGYGADGITYHNNRHAFDKLSLWPRVLKSLKNANTNCVFGGFSLSSPVIIAPMAHHQLVDINGEIATAQAASLTKTPFCVSTQASCSLESVAASAPNLYFFQLYKRKNINDNLDLVDRAQNAGYKAIVLTVDTPVSGVRNCEMRAGFQLPKHIKSVNLAPYGEEEFIAINAGSPVFQGMLDDAADWEFLQMLCNHAQIPVYVKGILHPQDAQMAIDAGCRGIIVSNHGGRALDSVPATITVLPLIAKQVAGQVPILLDGSIRRGSDIVKALALGANAVLLGRPILYGLGVAGMVGVVHVLTLLQTELEIAMALCGCASLSDISRDIIYCSPNIY
ncbi:alpha-hydroxy acid oxidase [Bartonella sp. HY038]|uniref:alpha-hydroxy acid oxidase n=1 Tax=Bartonella sp. HY038 TaxID=2759660 RepID=UPI0015FD9868|nr:alpha-hydroxy acid oxidase [Bartonella sp. HY038]